MFEAADIPITPEVLSLIAEIDEFKGAWRALGSFRDINTKTRNKLYVACSRARGNLTFVPESLLKAHKRPSVLV